MNRLEEEERIGRRAQKTIEPSTTAIDTPYRRKKEVSSIARQNAREPVI